MTAGDRGRDQFSGAREFAPCTEFGSGDPQLGQPISALGVTAVGLVGRRKV